MRSFVEPRTDEDFNKELRERLTQVLGDVPQAEIARRTGTIRNNVNRYFSGRKMPADFCAALIKAFDINPTWLFTGEGSPRVADKAIDMSDKVDNLLGLVNSMQAVMKMRMGELAGKSHLKELRRLSDALDALHALRDKLNKEFIPVFRALLGQYETAVNAMDYSNAEGVHRVLEQVARICDDDDLHLQYNALAGIYYGNIREIDKALDASRKVFWLTILKGEEKLIDLVSVASNYAIELTSIGRVQEARGVLSTVIGTLEGVEDPDKRSLLWHTRFTYELTTCHLGNIDNALTVLMRAYRHMSKAHKGNSRVALMSILTAAGVVSLEERIDGGAKGPNPSLRGYDAGDMIMHACFRHDVKLLGAARKKLGKTLAEVPETRVKYWDLYSEKLLDGLEGKKEAIDDFLTEDVVRQRSADKNSMHRLSVPVGACQIAIACEAYAQANTQLKNVEAIRKECPKRVTLPMMLIGRHMKNVLLLHDAGKLAREHGDLPDQANAFLEKHANQGYAVFESDAPSA